ncbi:MAG: transglutaminase-like domain-containing protein [Bacteroidia bacterium]
MLNINEIRSLVSLLDDDDPEVLFHIENKILELGKPVIPFLEEEWHILQSPEHQNRVENIIHRIQFTDLCNNIEYWYKNNQQNLLEGVYLIAKYKFPQLELQEIANYIDKMRLDAWLEMHMDLTPYEKVRILNYVVYQSYGFAGNTNNYHDPQNSYINQVLESKKGNPILLAVVYMLIAQKLNIPIFGVNLPQHFVLAYTEEKFIHQPRTAFNDIDKLIAPEGKVLFYINAFNNGSVFSKANLEQFLKQINIEPKADFFEPCSNLDIVKRILRNLVSAYEKTGKKNKMKDIQHLLFILGEPPLNDFKEIQPED